MSGPQSKGGDNQPQQERKKKESILELSKFLEKSVRIKFAGGRECSGVLKVKLSIRRNILSLGNFVF